MDYFSYADMGKVIFYIMIMSAALVSCTAHKLLTFSAQRWHVDACSGNARSSGGLELGFGSEWMVTDTTLIQTPQQMARYPKLSQFLAKGIAQFPEIAVDSIYFYNPHRGLLFVKYHQVKPLKPTSEISLYDGVTPVYSKEYSLIFGDQTTYIDPDGWERGPENSVYSNVRYCHSGKYAVQLLRIPYAGNDIAVISIYSPIPKKGKWWEEYPPGTFSGRDPGNGGNIERIALALHSSRTLAVENLRLASSRKPLR